MTAPRPGFVQVALVQLDNYGPWTVTPEPRRETDLQALQARLYAALVDFVGDRDGYAFYGRFDNMVAVTNGLDPSEYAAFQRRVRNRYPVTVSVGVGRAGTPVAAMRAASESLQAAGSAQDEGRREALRVGGDDPAAPDGPDPTPQVGVAHFDVVDATSAYTDQGHAYEADLAVREATLALSRYMHRRHDSVSYFVGGDNVISVCPPLPEAAFDGAIDHVRERTGVPLRVGVGRGETARAAGTEAKHALERCRETGRQVGGNTAESD